MSDSEESDIIEILRRSAPQSNTVWTFYECIKFYLFSFSGMYKNSVTTQVHSSVVQGPTIK